MQKLKHILVLTGLFFIFSCGSAMAADWTVEIDGQPIDAEVKIVDGRSLVPLRTIGEALGLAVEWHSDTQEIVLDASALLSHKEKNDTVTLNCQNGTYKAFIENKEKYRMYTAVLNAKNGALKMLVLPVNIDGRIYVPVRLICDSFGAPVAVENNTITIGQCFTDEEVSIDKVLRLVYSDKQLAEAIYQAIDYMISAIDNEVGALRLSRGQKENIEIAESVQQLCLAAIADWESANNSCFLCAETRALKKNIELIINELKKIPSHTITPANCGAFFESVVICINTSTDYLNTITELLAAMGYSFS